jgi:translin
VTQYTNALNGLAVQAQVTLATIHKAREKALPATREVIRLCANSIRATHRKEFKDARSILKSAQLLLDETREALSDHQEIYYTGYMSDAQKEYSEAWATFAFISGTSLLSPKDIRVDIAPYLNGIAEAASELRRSILDALRNNDIEPCEEWMTTMDEVYSLLITLDYPDAVTAGLRRTTDQLRGVLERTRGDFTMALRQHSLERRIAHYEERFPPATPQQ